MNRRERSPREHEFPQRRRTPSFSSSLLDAIYRSIDESNGGEQVFGGQFRERASVQKQSKSVSVSRRDSCFEEENDFSNFRRGMVMDSWMEKRSTRSYNHYNSASSSSDSSYGGGVFSSSETDSSSKGTSRRIPSFTPQRTNLSENQRQSKCEGGFTKTKLKALKIYGELKKVKQPISPGGRIASFLNSLFSSSSAKKVKTCSIGAMEDVRFEPKSKSACSSVTSFSRSCLNKTPPPRAKSGPNATKRSVRFYPVSVIVDEDSRPCGQKCIYEDDPGLMPMPKKIVKSCSVKEDVAKGSDHLRSHKYKNARKLDFKGYIVKEDDDDDAESCSSSDLFELDHLIGIGKYTEELPVFETTSLKTNQAIANGFIL
ncbi:hypothetical protein K2173_015841 [Erythroxylum novogranatense]|uniref:Protein BIG GRAIN 1-like B n=1 Tax=Erythroxylum novogranatense TaxID=1862640 RepID=A0AAV8SFF9_9ROSI|nr:hypothetical protein K2173_015841 [Erythroxylum novogranatense]